MQATFDGLTTRSGRYGSLGEYKNFAHARSPKGLDGVMTCPRQAVKTGWSARNCPHWSSAATESMRGQPIIWPRSQVDWRLA